MILLLILYGFASFFVISPRSILIRESGDMGIRGHGNPGESGDIILFYAYAFLGLPGGPLRKSRPVSPSTTAINSSPPAGRPVRVASRSRTVAWSSPLPRNSFQLVINPSSVRSFTRGSISETPVWYRALDHGYPQACFTIPTRTGFNSTYRAAESRGSWSRMHELNRPWKRYPRTPSAKFFNRV